jgi:hypothetical protein
LKSLKTGAVPTVFKWSSSSTPSATQLARQHRARRRQLLPHSTRPDGNHTKYVFDLADAGPTVEVETITKTVVDTEQCPDLTLRCEMDCSTQTDNCILPDVSVASQTDRHPLLSLVSCSHDNELVHFYSGLENYDKVMFVLGTLGPAAYHLRYMYGAVTDISVEDQFFLVLVKLRQHKTNFELAKLFGVSEADGISQVYSGGSVQRYRVP